MELLFSLVLLTSLQSWLLFWMHQTKAEPGSLVGCRCQFFGDSCMDGHLPPAVTLAWEVNLSFQAMAVPHAQVPRSQEPASSVFLLNPSVPGQSW